MSDEKRATISLVSNPETLHDIRKMVKLADRLSFPDNCNVEIGYGKVTITAWLSQVAIPRGRGT